MSVYTAQIINLESQYNNTQALIKKIDSLIQRLETMNDRYAVMLEAQQLLATVSDTNTNAVLDYITGIINKTLGEIFPHDPRRVHLERKLYNGQHAHINVKLTGTGGKSRDMVLQTGTGLGQAVSVLFALCLIEIRKGRRLFIADELLNGLHPVAKGVLLDIFKLFTEDGFQFIMVEYGADNVGKMYLVEKPSDETKITPLHDKKYHNEIFVFNRPPEDVDLSIRVEESDGEE